MKDASKRIMKSVAVPIVFGGFLLVVLLSPLGSGSSTRLVAVLTFIGVLVNYSATVIELNVQRHAQDRLDEEHDQTEKRLAQEQQEQSRRLELDAAMRAGQLISPTDSRSGRSAALASGLLALTNLNQAELAVSLLVDLWSDKIKDDGTTSENRDDTVANEIAVLVINRALCSNSPNAQMVAAELLCRNATKLTSTQSLHWPAVLDGRWRPDFGARTKLLLVEALVNMTVCPNKPVNEAALRAIAVRLYGISEDPEERVKACVGKLIDAILPMLELCKSREFAQGNVMVDIEHMRIAAAHPKDNPDGYLSALSEQLATHLKDWAKNATGLPSNTGCLATAASGDGTTQPTPS